MAQALGYRLLDAAGRGLAPGGVALAGLARIDSAGVHTGLRSARFLAATDVRNRLCGREGASAMYGPQKGADEAAIDELDRALYHFAQVVESELGVPVLDLAGGGAAGGLGAGVVAFLGAEIRPGAEVVGHAARLPARVAEADIVITGEGRLDGQTAFGKAPSYVASLAKGAGKPVICLPGSLGAGFEASAALFDVVVPCSEGRGPPPSPVAARDALTRAAASALRQVLAGRA
jgi:glycerate kinase